MPLQIYGSVIVQGKEYNDDEIASLVGTDVAGWKFGGDQLPEESDICIDSICDSITFNGDKTLEHALAFIAGYQRN